MIFLDTTFICLDFENQVLLQTHPGLIDGVREAGSPISDDAAKDMLYQVHDVIFFVRKSP